jgi:hypothetical protein
VVRNWAEIKGKQGGEQRISGWMGCFLAGRGLIKGGSVDVDCRGDALYSSIPLPKMLVVPLPHHKKPGKFFSSYGRK